MYKIAESRRRFWYPANGLAKWQLAFDTFVNFLNRLTFLYIPLDTKHIHYMCKQQIFKNKQFRKMCLYLTVHSWQGIRVHYVMQTNVCEI